MRIRPLASLAISTAVLVPVVSSCTSEPALGRHESAVINGDLDSGDPAVVALMEGPYFFCSGTVISPHVVLTAAHCLEGGSAAGLTIFFGTDSTHPTSGTVIPAKSILYHPEYGGYDHDLGVVELMQPTTVAPAIRNTTALSATMAGQDVRVVGFGLSVDSQFSDEAGVKRTGLTTFDSIESDYMMVSPQNNQSGCYGDSGGPNFMTIGGHEVLAGITSFGTEDSCLAGQGGNTDVQKYTAWIDDFVATAEGGAVGPTCDADGSCVAGCATPDPDCPIDPGPLPGGDDDTGDDTGGDDAGPSSGGCSAGGTGDGLVLIVGVGMLLAWDRRKRRGRPGRAA